MDPAVVGDKMMYDGLGRVISMADAVGCSGSASDNVGRRRRGEFWLPVRMSPAQIHEYCNILIEHFEVLRSGKSCQELRDLVKLLQNCCCHPYTVSGKLLESIERIVPPQELLLLTIKASGKLELMHKMLQELWTDRKRVLILIQSAGAMKACGRKLIDILDDYLRQQYGSESYERIERHMERQRTQAGLQRFNAAESKCFVLLSDRNDCIYHMLYSLDAVFIYESDLNPLHDTTHLQRMGITTNVNVYRLYSCLSIEESMLVYSQQGGNVNGNLNNVVLQWGAKLLVEIDEWCLRNGLCKDLGRGWQLDGDGTDKWKDYLVFLDKNDLVALTTANISPQLTDKLKLPTEHTVYYDMDVSAKHFWSLLLKNKHARLMHLQRRSVPKHAGYAREEAKRKKDIDFKHHFLPVLSSHADVNQREQEEALVRSAKLELKSLCELLKLPMKTLEVAEDYLAHMLKKIWVRQYSIHEVELSMCWIVAEQMNLEFDIFEASSMAFSSLGFEIDKSKLNGVCNNLIEELDEPCLQTQEEDKRPEHSKVVAKKRRKGTTAKETEPPLPVFITNHKKRLHTERPGVLVDCGLYYLYYPAYSELPKDFPKSLISRISDNTIIRDQIVLLYESNIEKLYRCGMLKCDVSNEEDLEMYFDLHISRAILWASQFCYDEEWRFNTKKNVLEAIEQDVIMKENNFQDKEHLPEKTFAEVKKNQLPEVIAHMLYIMLHLDGDSLFYVQAQAEQLGLCPDVTENTSLKYLFNEVDDEDYKFLINLLHKLIMEGMGIYIRVGAARFLEILVCSRPIDMKQYACYWTKRYSQLLDDLVKRVILEKPHFKKCFAAAHAVVLSCGDDGVVEEKLSYVVNMYRSGDMGTEVAILLKEFFHQASDRVKDHTTLILPLTFIGRFDEDEFVSIHCEQIWKEHFSHHSTALVSCTPALVALLFDGLAASSYEVKQQSAKVIVKLLEEAGQCVAPFSEKLMARLLDELGASPWKGKVSILEAIAAICERYSQAFSACKEIEIINALVCSFSCLKERFFQNALCSCLVKVLDSFPDIDASKLLPPIVLDQVSKKRAARVQQGVLKSVTIEQLKHLSGVQKGSALFGTIIKPGLRCSGPTYEVMVTIVDQNGDVIKVIFDSWCFEYCENVVTRLPRHATLVIKDPKVHNQAIEVETMSTVDIISLFSDKKQANLEKMSARDLREEGNGELRRGKLHQALELYSLSIRKAANNKHELLLGYSNRAQCYLRLHRFNNALKDAEKALKIDGTHLKSLVRKGSALQHLQCGKSIHGDHNLSRSGENIRNEDLQLSEYGGEVEIKSKDRRRGLFAVIGGNLILVTNALAEGTSHGKSDIIAKTVAKLTKNSTARATLASLTVPSIFKPNRVFNMEKKQEVLDMNTVMLFLEKLAEDKDIAKELRGALTRSGFGVKDVMKVVKLTRGKNLVAR